MKSAVVLLGLLCTGCVARAEPVVYRLDPEHSFVHFEVLHFGTSTIRGRFGPAAGFVEIDRTAARGYADVRIATGSVDTGIAAFDARLREGDLLAADAWPQASFVGTRFRFEGDRVAGVAGELTLRGQTQPLQLKALRFGCHIHPQLQREVCGGDFEAELNRGDFGMSFGLPFVAARVRLLVQVEGIQR